MGWNLKAAFHGNFVCYNFVYTGKALLLLFCDWKHSWQYLAISSATFTLLRLKHHCPSYSKQTIEENKNQESHNLDYSSPCPVCMQIVGMIKLIKHCNTHRNINHSMIQFLASRTLWMDKCPWINNSTVVKLESTIQRLHLSPSYITILVIYSRFSKIIIILSIGGCHTTEIVSLRH